MHEIHTYEVSTPNYPRMGEIYHATVIRFIEDIPRPDEFWYEVKVNGIPILLRTEKRLAPDQRRVRVKITGLRSRLGLVAESILATDKPATQQPLEQVVRFSESK